jgi:Ca2+-binding RTX toxin-like protein
VSENGDNSLTYYMGVGDPPLYTSTLAQAGKTHLTVWSLTSGDTIIDDGGFEYLRLNGYDGDDTIYAGASYQTYVYGDDGNDVIHAGTGFSFLYGGGGADIFVFDSYATSSSMLAGTDQIEDFQTGIDRIDLRGMNPTSVRITPYSGGGNDIYATTAQGTFTLYVRHAVTLADIDYLPVEIIGTALGERLEGSYLDNVLRGLGGDDILLGAGGDDLIDGGEGRDTANYLLASDGVTVSLRISGAQDTGGDGVDTLVSIENLFGSYYDDVLIGDGLANDLNGYVGADWMIGGRGDDSYHVDDAGDVVLEYADQGIDSVEATISYVLPDHVENLTLGYYNNIDATGNALANVLIGNGYANVLDGKGGADRMEGGQGDDTYVIDNVGDVVVEAADAGVDTIRTVYSWTLGANVENLVLLGSGNLSGTGNGLANVLTGNSGNNLLDGKGGADRMIGGAGNDTYVIDNVGDVVVEAAGGGIDVVRSVYSWTLADNVEQLVLLGSGNLNGTGNRLSNVLTGNAGNNLLDGKGGADRMIGGAGNDTYVIDNVGDVVVEAAGGGSDTVRSVYSWTLGDNIENLTLLGSGNLNGTGNGLSNVLTGNAGNNVLDGKGGADRMIGGAGNDTYIIDNVGDVVVEAADGGTDTIRSVYSWTLADNVEQLVLLGSGNLNGTGNGLANVLTGNSGNNVLDGKGGADRMIGGAGNDTYVIDNVGDIVVEEANGGTDTIRTVYSWTLGANIENLVLSGSGNLRGTGNALDNVITGNAGANSIYGGLGADVLTGGAGADRFTFDTAPGGGNVDRITDFAVGQDKIFLDDAIFAGLGGTGTLAAGAFHVGAGATDAGDRILYDSATGALFYDADGSGAGAVVQFATLSAGLVLTNADFVVF